MLHLYTKQISKEILVSTVSTEAPSTTATQKEKQIPESFKLYLVFAFTLRDSHVWRWSAASPQLLRVITDLTLFKKRLLVFLVSQGILNPTSITWILIKIHMWWKVIPEGRYTLCYLKFNQLEGEWVVFSCGSLAVLIPALAVTWRWLKRFPKFLSCSDLSRLHLHFETNFSDELDTN